MTQSNQKNRNYIGLASTDFKARLGQHKQTFKDKNKSQTSISNYKHELKSKKIDFEISWRIVDKGYIYPCYKCVQSMQQGKVPNFI